MEVQIFGTKKCRDTDKALRFFKERRVKVHFVNLAEKGMSKGELGSVSRSVPLEELIDREGKEYGRRNLLYIGHDIRTELLEHPLLFRTPVVRFAGKATVGHAPDAWAQWLKEG